ncbi:MAG: vWA domain-containing protein, partial [Acidobacteriota bacterium]
MEPLTFELPWVLVLLPVVVALAIHIGRAGHRLLSPARLRAVRVLRPLSAALLVLALAGAAFERREDRLTVIFAVDGSRSVGGAGNPQTERWLTEAVQQIPENDRAGVVVFGREAMIDTVPTDQIRSGEVLARPADDGTDIEAAIRLARGLFPPQQEARLVLLSDGVETRGSVEQIAAVLPPELDLVWTPIAPPRASEVMVEQISVPEKVVEGEPHRVRVVARSSTATTATLRLFRGSVPVAAIPVELPAGQSRVFAFDQVAPLGSGVLLYRARIEAATDTTPENNRGQALVEVAGRPSVLIVDREPGAITPLADALRQAGMRVRSGRPGLLPADV